MSAAALCLSVGDRVVIRKTGAPAEVTQAYPVDFGTFVAARTDDGVEHWPLHMCDVDRAPPQAQTVPA